MGLPKVLIIGLAKNSPLGERLRQILCRAYTTAFEEEKVPHRVVEGSGGVETDPCSAPSAVILRAAMTSSETTGELIAAVRRASPAVPIVLLIDARERCPRAVATLLRRGADDFVTPPLEPRDLLPRLWRLGSYHEEGTIPRVVRQVGLKRLIGESARFLQVTEKIPVVAKCDAAVLISGETGTGKEVCARAIHYVSPRSRQTFLPVNCGAIPVDLLENELFGHERDAFTGASTSRRGLVEEATRGTLFLDEIDCLRPSAQVKLLRLLQEKEYRPLGSTHTKSADIRLIAATNVDPSEAVRGGKIRQDLYYRLNVLPIQLPPLRDRGDDVLLLARHFLLKAAADANVPAPLLSPEAEAALRLHDWPGNVRELEHVIARGVILADGRPVIEVRDIQIAGSSSRETTPFQESKRRVIEEFERKYISTLLRVHRGNITHAARAAKKNRRAFWELIRKHGINVEQIRASTTPHC